MSLTSHSFAPRGNWAGISKGLGSRGTLGSRATPRISRGLGSREGLRFQAKFLIENRSQLIVNKN